jgi:hypothetical protein
MRILNSSHSIRFESENILQKAVFREENQPKLNSKMLLEGTELLIREFKHPGGSSKGMNITSFTNFPEEDMIHYLDGKHYKVDSLRFLDTF